MDDYLSKFYKETLSEGNFRLFIGFALDVLLKPWERFVMALKYTEVRPPNNYYNVNLTSCLARRREVWSWLESYNRLPSISNNIWGDKREIRKVTADLDFT